MTHEVSDPFNRLEERAPINLVPPALQNAFLAAHQAVPVLFGLTEFDLFKELRTQGRGITPTDNQLRLSFWLEYDRCQEESRAFNVGHVYSGICTKSFFYGTYLRYPDKVAWLLTPPVEYEVKLREAHDFGLSKMREILDQDAISNRAKPDTKLLDLQLKIFTMLDQRLKGGYTQRQEVKSLQITASAADVKAATTEETMRLLNARLKELDSRERIAQRLPMAEPKEVKSDADS